jgi:flagellar biosynthesis protein FlhB
MPNDDKTEAATPQRRKDARKKGQVAKSTEATSALGLLAGLFALKASAPAIMGQLSSTMTRSLGNLSSFHATPEGVHDLFIRSMFTMAACVGPLLGVLMVTGLVSNVAQVGWSFNSQSLAPDVNKINPMKGLARMFSPRGMVELLKTMLKLGILCYVTVSFFRSEKEAISTLGIIDRGMFGAVASDLIWKLCLRVGTVMAVVAALDYGYQRFQFEKSIKMTKQEIKEEMKQSEGDQFVKSQFRHRHRQMAQGRMMQDVPKADVIVTNPTHIAVALKYDGATMAAPIVLAKGQEFMAQRIKEIAREHKIPMVENKPVARALFAAAEVGHPIPVDLYGAVAEILAFIYRLKRGGLRATA